MGVAGALVGGVEVDGVGEVLLALVAEQGVRSPPPPNQLLVVAMKRVFMCTAGTRGLRMWAIRLTPVAKNRGSSSAPGMDLAISGVKVPNTVETWTPTFSNRRPCIIDMTPPPPAARSQGLRTNRPGSSA